MEKDYKLLDLDISTATLTEIKNAYRLKLLRYHPDKSGTMSTKHEFVKIKSAYDNIIRSLKSIKHNKKYPDIHHKIKISLHMAMHINKIEFKRIRFKILNGNFKEYIETKTLLIPPNMRRIVYKEAGDQPVGFDKPGDVILYVTLCHGESVQLPPKIR